MKALWILSGKLVSNVFLTLSVQKLWAFQNRLFFLRIIPEISEKFQILSDFEMAITFERIGLEKRLRPFFHSKFKGLSLLCSVQFRIRKIGGFGGFSGGFLKKWLLCTSGNPTWNLAQNVLLPIAYSEIPIFVLEQKILFKISGMVQCLRKLHEKFISKSYEKFAYYMNRKSSIVNYV